MEKLKEGTLFSRSESGLNPPPILTGNREGYKGLPWLKSPGWPGCGVRSSLLSGKHKELAKDSEKNVYLLWNKASSPSETDIGKPGNRVAETQNTVQGAIGEDDGPRSIYRTLKRHTHSRLNVFDCQSQARDGKKPSLALELCTGRGSENREMLAND